MRRLIPVKFLSWVLLVVTLAVTFNCVHASAHAMQGHVTAASDRPHSEISVSHQCPCAPSEQHEDYDGCDTCVNCACHAPLAMHQFQLSYNPIILDLSIFDPFTRLPEVYLSKFIPPQNQA